MKKSRDTKSHLHPRNKHRKPYNFQKLIEESPSLAPFVSINKYGNESVNFFDSKAIIELNKALLKTHYSIKEWEVPESYLCPPIPGRADYVHYIADLLAEENKNVIPKGEFINCLDIGTGASCIYPILGQAEYKWNFLGTDTDDKALKSAKRNIQKNEHLKLKIRLTKQTNNSNFFEGVIRKNDRFDITLCNPPFHASAEEAKKSALQKNTNLQKKKLSTTNLNFGGQRNELWYNGGEYNFVRKMIFESKNFANNCLWFSTLVSKKENLKHFYKALKETDAIKVKTIEMKQGQKVSRIICWTFLSDEKRKIWKELRWQ